MKRGEVWWVNFHPSVGGEIQKQRPAVIVSNDASNKYLNRIQLFSRRAEQVRACGQSQSGQADRSDDSTEFFGQSRSSNPMIKQSKIGNRKSKIVRRADRVIKRGGF